MSVNAYLYVNGVEGPSTSKLNHIDILGFDWGVRQTAVYGKGASGKEAKAGRADFTSLNVMKVLDKTTPLLVNHCATGDILKEVYVVLGKPTADKQEDYFRVYLKDALITAVNLSGNSDQPMESISFAFQGIEVAYKAEKDDGQLDAAMRKGYDLSTLNGDFAATKDF